MLRLRREDLRQSSLFVEYHYLDLALVNCDLQLRLFYSFVAQKSKVAFLLEVVTEVFLVNKRHYGLCVG